MICFKITDTIIVRKDQKIDFILKIIFYFWYLVKSRFYLTVLLYLCINLSVNILDKKIDI